MNDERMNTNQRVGFIYRVVEDQQKDKPLSPLDLKNLTHYADTGEWLDEEIKAFEQYREDKKALDVLHKFAERARELINKSSHVPSSSPWEKTIEEQLKDLAEYCSLVDKIKKENEQKIAEYNATSRMISQYEDCATLYKELLKELNNMPAYDLSRATLFELPNGEVCKCAIIRRGNRLIIKECQKIKL